MRSKPEPPKLEDFGLVAEDVEGLNEPWRLSDDANMVVGLGVGVPLALWSLWGVIKGIDMLALGIVIGVLVAVVVFQLSMFTAPLIVNVLLALPGFVGDEVRALFSDHMRRRLRYRRALNEYRNRLARGDG
ncbi:MAG: hypothetical protein HOL37_00010 [Rhodospirillaceae bacterium]|nr:hypothetical protein [Rhodospirillaceae bacterium]MBT4220342.1 hypothetical protein [Rhodospirillaceae bacterium]MBT4463691.1 hypothetical protein [Rhodospirillaceae bacterium]MBT5013872.1 hypothetical protein [Rhodospirillaceae bacterium]MBT5307697.1 hypothetical protein [Rhodospirillaceae bacterium]